MSYLSVRENYKAIKHHIGNDIKITYESTGLKEIKEVTFELFQFAEDIVSDKTKNIFKK